ncbi:monofunctional biosynthetic peptidoglycan transglycosylase [Sulfurimonas sp.]|uniref:monofunctional biosynthetic peptidoglycan transglycosylase n=1 Tax=Sulfurimonas sp. TaxID=2022749 RepID=UPI00262B8EFD|nr:monofunctional biosynthetic peptidoglycan transglycosylase [Sulfurimonas sp.]MDD5157690.1 monofunctional biosynthetic peptidoglycan transglycosylase [Sulfurimonas sp.]
MKIFLRVIFVIFIVMLLDILRYFVYPSVDSLKTNNPIPTAFMEYRTAEWANENRDIKINQKWVSIKNISPNLIKAVLIAEDDGFYKHDGFDIKGMENAIERSIKKGVLAGGSTISQQLSKNLYLSPSKNPIRKVKEAIITYRIEKSLSKRRILEIYLNIAEWGDGIFGIEAASRHYYGKSAKNLNAKEAARLATILPNPIKYNPLGNQKYVINRSAIIYKVMMRRGIVISAFKEVMALPKIDEIVKDENQSAQAVDETNIQNDEQKIDKDIAQDEPKADVEIPAASEQ